VNTLPLRTWVRNAAAVFSGAYGAVTGRAEQVGCSRQTVCQHAREVERRLDPATLERDHSALLAEDQRLRDQLATMSRRSDRSVVCDKAKSRRVATIAFAAGVSLRRIEDLFQALLPARLAPDHSTIGRWAAEGARKAGAILGPIDATCAARVKTLALDEIFFGGGRPWSGSSRRA